MISGKTHLILLASRRDCCAQLQRLPDGVFSPLLKLCHLGVEGEEVEFDGVDEGFEPDQEGLVLGVEDVVVAGLFAGETHDADEGVALALGGLVVADVDFLEAGDFAAKGLDVDGGAGLLRFGGFGLPAKAEYVKVHGISLGLILDQNITRRAGRFWGREQLHEKAPGRLGGDRSGLQPSELISAYMTQPVGLGWYDGAPTALELARVGGASLALEFAGVGGASLALEFARVG